jgi:hypothetical protein
MVQLLTPVLFHDHTTSLVGLFDLSDVEDL